jgi:hypothetical protein
MRLTGTAILVLTSYAAAAQRPVEFNRDVRPILSDKCWHCHGPDAKVKNVPLRLDSEAAAKLRAIVAGAPDQSPLIARITHEKKALRMPPAYSGLTLTPAEIETLKAWIAQGAPWRKHWSFIPPARAPGKSIDTLVLERLEKEGLRPSPAAKSVKLLRRVSLDLTGLPPSAAELEKFRLDEYEHAVDRLLASPRFGERMAARWLDAARYADTNGYQFDGPRDMWRWRDWVIEAFNSNMPYDRFALEQLAGDMLPGATLSQRIATGFNRNHRINTEDGIIPEEYAVEYVVDRVETASTVFLGLTMGCARCHNHKYDPITQKEFYQLSAYFNNVPEIGRGQKYGNSHPFILAPAPEQQKRLDELDRLIAQEGGPQSSTERGLDFEFKPEPALFDGSRQEDLGQKGGYDIEDRFTLAAWIRSDTAPDGSVAGRMTDSPTGRGYGMEMRAGRLHFHLTSNYADDAIRVTTEEAIEGGKWHHIAVTYTGSRMAEGITAYLNGRPAKVKVELDTLYRPFRNAGAQVRYPFRVGGGAGAPRRFKGEIRKVRAYARALSAAEVGMLAQGKRAPHENAKLWKLLDEREALERSLPTAMVMQESAAPKQTFFLNRGQYDQKGEPVSPGIPAVLPPLPAGAPNNRLGFAQWVASKENPLTARVAVNRFWQMLFGAGLVKTAEDFGAQGEWPSHPELLDWLACEFMESGWDVKRLMKTIVMSATYRRSSDATPEMLQRDPENRLLARGPRLRMPAEMVRDHALAVAGLLHAKIGGPSVKPYQPDGLWKELIMQDQEYVQSKGPDLYRRSLYTYWKRTVAPPMMANFDSALRETCQVRESRTNTPLQALNLMNDVTFVEAARMPQRS